MYGVVFVVLLKMSTEQDSKPVKVKKPSQKELFAAAQAKKAGAEAERLWLEQQAAKKAEVEARLDRERKERFFKKAEEAERAKEQRAAAAVSEKAHWTDFEKVITTSGGTTACVTDFLRETLEGGTVANTIIADCKKKAAKKNARGAKEQEYLAIVNANRAKLGMPPLTWASK